MIRNNIKKILEQKAFSNNLSSKPSAPAKPVLRDKVKDVKSDYLSARLFMSIDIVRSSKLKESWQASSDWQRSIRRFYRGFNTLLDSVDGLSLWKVNGDEMVYTMELTSEKELYHVLKNFCESVDLFLKKERALKQQGDSVTIEDVSCASWIAYFPFVNETLWMRRSRNGVGISSEASMAQNTNPSEYFIDFVGPTMDEGYRLASLASPGSLVLSVTCAAFLSHAIIERDRKREPLELSFCGIQKLKGVVGGEDYPVISVRNVVNGDSGSLERVPCSQWLQSYAHCSPMSPERGFEVANSHIESMKHDPRWFLYLSACPQFNKIPQAVLEYIASLKKPPADKADQQQDYDNRFYGSCRRWLKAPQLSTQSRKETLVKDNEHYFLASSPKR